MDRWQEKIRKLRKITKGWSSNEEASLKRYKKVLMDDYNKLDIKAETVDLTEAETTRHKFIHAELQKIWLQEEIKVGKDLGIETSLRVTETLDTFTL